MFLGAALIRGRCSFSKFRISVSFLISQAVNKEQLMKKKTSFANFLYLELDVEEFTDKKTIEFK